MKRLFPVVALTLLLAAGCAGCSGDGDSKEDSEKGNGGFVEKTKTYINPVFIQDSPDPSVMRGDDGYFYAFTTAGLRRSKDLVEWSALKDPFESRPAWSDVCKDVWAMDVNKIGDKYVLYYALSKWGEEHENGLGVAVADDIAGPYKDHGKLFTSNEIGVQNSIDPHYFIDDDGKQYLSWGSFSGLYAIELAADGLSVKEGAEKQKLAGNAYEGIMIHKHDGKYYMFASIGSCCEELNSSYTTVVGRADNYFGPYVNKAGASMLDNNHEILIAGSDAVKGPGHNSEIITDDEGHDWILYHGYLTTNPSRGRVLFMDPLHWTDGWPSVKEAKPCMIGQEVPVFK